MADLSFDDLIPSAEAPRAPAGAGVSFDDLVPAAVPAAAPAIAPAREPIPVGASGNAFARGLVNGLPIAGPYLVSGIDKLNAGIRAVENDTPYSEEAKRVQDYARATTEAHGAANMLGEVAGGVVGTAPLVVAAPAAFGAGAAPLAIRMGASALTSAGLGGADAAVRSGGDPAATAMGIGVGGVVGGLVPGAAAGVGKVASAISSRLQPNDILSSVPKAAREWAASELADPSKAAALRTELDRLGPEAMLADASPTWMGVARGAASRPNSRDAVVNALIERDAGKNTRIGGVVDRELGPAPIPSRVDAGLRASQEALGPHYTAAMADARAVDTTPLANRLDAISANLRGDARAAVQRARGYLNIPGTAELDPNPSALLQTRHALDGMLSTEQNPQVVMHLTGVRQDVDAELARAVPGIKDVDALYAELARQREGLQRGSMVLDGGKTAPRPAELTEEFSAGALPEGTLIGPSGVPMQMRAGARAEIDRIVGQNANDVSALNRLMKGEGDWNRDKLRTLFGADRADRILGVLDAEQVFQRTAGRVAAGSDTAMASRFGDFLDQAAVPSMIPLEASATGLAARGAQKLLGAASKSRAEDNAQRFAEELGRLSVAQGSARDQIVQALMTRANRPDYGPGAEAVARALLAGAPPATNRLRLAR